MKKKLRHLLLWALLVLSLLVCVFIVAVYAGAFGRLPDKSELQHVKTASATLIFSEDGELIGKFFLENRTNIAYDRLPVHLKDALIATEDIRFYKHKGFDGRSFFRVLFKTILLSNPSSGGGSTITQQLAKNLYGRKNGGFPSIIPDKTKEILLARRLEKTFSKQDILALYLNTVPFGENVYGIEAAAKRFFSKNTESLSMEESTVLIGMLKANTLYNPRLYPERSLSRRNIVLSQMEKYGYLTSTQADSLRQLPLMLSYANILSGNPAAYFLNRVKDEARQILDSTETVSGVAWNLETDGLLIRTTLNHALQQYAVQSFREHLSEMQNRLDAQYRSVAGQKLLDEITRRELQRLQLLDRAEEVRLQRVFHWEGSYADSLSVTDSLRHALGLLHAGMMAISPASGAVLTYVGGIDYLTNPYDQIQARRQLASAFKPILYAAALENGTDPCEYFENDSLVITDYHGYSPANHDHSYGGKYSMSGALARSMNVPTFNLYLQTGFEPVNNLWQKMGFSFPLTNSPALAMGTAEASISETAVAYAAFVNGGYLLRTYTIESIATPDGKVLYQREQAANKERIISEDTGFLIRAMLEKAVKEGTAASLRSRYGLSLPLAGKTGTSQNYADAWFAALGPELVMVSRVGASSPLIHFNSGHYGSASSLALPLVALSLQKAQHDRALSSRISKPFPALPPHLAQALDCPDYQEKGVLEQILDLFLDKSIQFEEDVGKKKPKRASWLKRIFGSRK
jgi:penicillin-binding protein 1A